LVVLGLATVHHLLVFLIVLFLTVQTVKPTTQRGHLAQLVNRRQDRLLLHYYTGTTVVVAAADALTTFAVLTLRILLVTVGRGAPVRLSGRQESFGQYRVKVRPLDQLLHAAQICHNRLRRFFSWSLWTGFKPSDGEAAV
jgi:hypothetical protein